MSGSTDQMLRAVITMSRQGLQGHRVLSFRRGNSSRGGGGRRRRAPPPRRRRGCCRVEAEAEAVAEEADAAAAAEAEEVAAAEVALAEVGGLVVPLRTCGRSGRGAGSRGKWGGRSDGGRFDGWGVRIRVGRYRGGASAQVCGGARSGSCWRRSWCSWADLPTR